MKIQPPFLTPAQVASHRRNLKRAWSAYGAAFVLFVVSASAGGGLMALALVIQVASGIWLAVVVSRAASAKGLSGPLWGVGTLALGPIGGILFPWLILLKL